MKLKTGIMVGRGLGDVVADFTHITGLDKLSGLYTQMTGKDCGCKHRQDTLNNIFSV